VCAPMACRYGCLNVLSCMVTTQTKVREGIRNGLAIIIHGKTKILYKVKQPGETVLC
jgi:hypothetical protein